jgi:molybdopterin molybdotransferase
VTVLIVDEARAGHPATASVEPGSAIRIMTGGMIPAGADAVVRFEDTDEYGEPGRPVAPGNVIGIRRGVVAGRHIRAAGEDLRAGETALERGTVLRPAEIGVLATLNRTQVAVHRRPVVAILATGDEIVEPGQALGPGQIWNSNSVMMASMVEAAGGEARVLGVARDSTPHLRAKLRAERGADMLITTGGVSIGDYDLVKQVLRADGKIDFWQVRMRPGKPLAFGQLEGTPLLGLPGNPVAAAVAFEQFARPAIRLMLGRRDLLRPVIQARLAEPIDNAGGRRQYLRVRVDAGVDGFVAFLAGVQGSSTLSSLARANGLLIVPETMTAAAPGDVLSVQMLDWDA